VQQHLPPPERPAVTKLLIANSAELAFGVSLPQPVRSQLTPLRREATTEGIHRAFWWCAFFAVLALGVSTFLPLRPG
jgi:hypothetical protein